MFGLGGDGFAKNVVVNLEYFNMVVLHNEELIEGVSRIGCMCLVFAVYNFSL